MSFKLTPLRSPYFSTFQSVDDIDGKRTTLLLTAGTKSRGTAEGQEGSSFARTAYLHFKRFVDNPDATRCTHTEVEERGINIRIFEIVGIISIPGLYIYIYI